MANDGILMKPRIVKEVINPETNTTTEIEPVQVRQVISKSTADRMVDLMESVVEDGSGRLAKVKGYSVGGKTGTSEPQAGADSSFPRCRNSTLLRPRREAEAQQHSSCKSCSCHFSTLHYSAQVFHEGILAPLRRISGLSMTSKSLELLFVSM